MRVKRDGRWDDLSYRHLGDQVRDLSLGLLELGLGPGDRVAILSENRPEWAAADYACLAARCTDVPVYPTLPARQIEHILRDSGSAAIFVSSRAQLDKVRAIRSRLPNLRHIIAFDDVAGGGDVHDLRQVQRQGRTAVGRHAHWREQALSAAPVDLATLIYTSGTTGDPKGVMLTHGNIASNVTAALSLFTFGPSDECLSFLPLSHIFERMLGHYALFYAGVTINYATSMDTVAAELLERRPTVVASVPRLYEKILARVLETVRQSSLPRRRIFTWSRAVGETYVNHLVARRPMPRRLALRYALADRLVFRKLRARTGGRIRFFVSGGAPLAPDIARFFYAAGMPIYEGYGLTETSPVIAANRPGRVRPGTVGPPIPGVAVRIANDGEIVVRGPNVMQGYFGKPGPTAEAIDPEGWFHTGDIGMIDDEGCLRITDRKKDLIVTAGGKNIAPQPIESLAKTSKYVSNAVMLGDRRRFTVMLVVPNFDALRAWGAHQKFDDLETGSLLDRPEVRAKLESELAAALADLARHEMPKKFLFLPHDFSVESGELTPTLKVRRRVVEEHHRSALEALYADPSHDTPTRAPVH